MWVSKTEITALQEHVFSVCWLPYLWFWVRPSSPSWKLVVALPSGYFHLDFLIGTSVLICRIVKAPAPWGGLICFYYCMLSHLVSYHLLSHPWHLSSITHKSCCVSILSLESGLAFAQRCCQPRTSAHLPLWQPTLAPGSCQESGPCGRRIWLYSSLLKAPGGLSPRYNLKLLKWHVRLTHLLASACPSCRLASWI